MIVVATFVAGITGLFVLRLIGGQLLTVQSNSMSPLFTAGDMVLTLPTKNNILGSVISYHDIASNNVIVSHRAVGLKDGSSRIIVRGDTQKTPSVATVSRDHVVGRVVAVIPLLGKFIGIIRLPTLFAIIIYLPFVLYLAREVSIARNNLARPYYQLIGRR